MAENYIDAERDYMHGMKYKDIATKYGVSINTVKSWKQRYNWNKKSVHTKKEKVCTQKQKKVAIPDDGTKETLLNDELTDEQQMFCVYYSRTFNATQSYAKAYGCAYSTANVRGSMLMAKPHIKKEIGRLKEIKRQQILAGEEDIVELHMRIAFSDIGNYLQFGQMEVEVMGPFGPIEVDGEILTKVVNCVKLNESETTDTQIIQEVKQGKSGVSVKLADKQKSLDWLDKYFVLNPMDKHKIEFDNKKIELLEKETEIKVIASGKIESDDVVRIVEDI